MADETTEPTFAQRMMNRGVQQMQDDLSEPTEQVEVWTDLTADVTYPEADPEPTEQAGREALAEPCGRHGRAPCSYCDPKKPVDALARLLIATWERVEAPVGVSYIADFADMARDVLRAGYVPPSVHAAVVADRDALQRRLDEAEAALREVYPKHFDQREWSRGHTDNWDDPLDEALDGGA